jgi:hypothetical protein
MSEKISTFGVHLTRPWSLARVMSVLLIGARAGQTGSVQRAQRRVAQGEP